MLDRCRTPHLDAALPCDCIPYAPSALHQSGMIAGTLRTPSVSHRAGLTRSSLWQNRQNRLWPYRQQWTPGPTRLLGKHAMGHQLIGKSGSPLKGCCRTLERWTHERGVVGRAKVLGGEANPRFVARLYAAFLREALLRSSRDGEPHPLRRIGLAHTEFAGAACGTIRLKLLKLCALVRISMRRIRVAMTSAASWQSEFELAHIRLEADGAQTTDLRRNSTAGVAAAAATATSISQRRHRPSSA
jgi:hypothetical protein